MRHLEIDGQEHLLFISDLHLCESRQPTTAAFFSFLDGPARAASRLFILGDLFEYWAGDDDDSPFAARVASRLRACADAGPQCLFMRGNRDFLVGEQFAARAGLALLDDPAMVLAGGHRLLLSHGDALCTDDLAYQQFRAQVRSNAWQSAFLAKPVAERRSIIDSARRESESAKKAKALAIMDANADAIASTLREHDYPTLIHGHTHRCARHRHTVDDHLCERWVLPDWHDCAHYLEWQAGSARFRRLARPDRSLESV